MHYLPNIIKLTDPHGGIAKKHPRAAHIQIGDCPFGSSGRFSQTKRLLPE
jgi:hypothetical protein